MKNKINFRCLILPLLGAISIASCKKDASVQKPNEKLFTNAVSIENDYLKFRDQKAFDSILNVLLKPENINSKPKELANFKSYSDIYLEIAKEYDKVNNTQAFNEFRNKYSGIVEIKSDSSLAYKSRTPISALFTNLKGEVKIGDITTVYTKDQRMVSYSGKHKSELEVNDISRTDMTKGIFVSNISTKASTSGSNQPSTEAEVVTTAIKSQLYYNEDGKRRLFVDLWLESMPAPSTHDASFRYYFTSRQELKRTFGGWRTNETDYYFSNLNYNFSGFTFPMGPEGVTYNFNLPSYSVGNATGPIIIDLGVKTGLGNGISGTGRFFTGGVPNAPSFNVN
ncbi:hypothetical protein [Pedobacter roseus]|uniref:DUF4848 domain-containing protein n=1 Tax=Pedobacter roseus TaxID=336820 RepID=A0A7G9QCS7_9SPHI|nr:hypothetical protein [Pedobacter roseus]QNN41152.1 hypothetical protein H9L23_18820 [Pedobacter roseus]